MRDSTEKQNRTGDIAGSRPFARTTDEGISVTGTQNLMPLGNYG
jgi:hypothetical protein